MNLKITLLGLFFIFFCFSKIGAWPQISPRRFGSEWGPGYFSEAVEAQRLLPILLYCRLQLQVIKYAAKVIVKHPNIKKIFAELMKSYLSH